MGATPPTASASSKLARADIEGKTKNAPARPETRDLCREISSPLTRHGFRRSIVAVRCIRKLLRQSREHGTRRCETKGFSICFENHLDSRLVMVAQTGTDIFARRRDASVEPPEFRR